MSVVNDLPKWVGSIPVGLDPVSVRFRDAHELWVINHISDSINVVDLSAGRVIATIQTLDAPEDIIWAGQPPQAFVTCSGVNTVQVFDVASRAEVARIPITGERPKAMALSPDGSKIYVAIFESGNASTILAPPFGKGLEPAGVADMRDGPYTGQNPPPNRGTNLFPALGANTNLPPNLSPPRVSLIVKRDTQGRWRDDNAADWTEFISGQNAGYSGRRPGWDLPDRDVAIVDVKTLSVAGYLTGLMNICMDVAVNPRSGRLAVIGSDAMNEVRFEPNLKGIFIRWRVAMVDPLTDAKTVKDLNPHLSYAAPSIPLIERDKSVADTRAVVWSSDGSRAYVSGMGSDNLVILDSEGSRIGQLPTIKLGEGAHGLALDEGRHRLYVLNRFAASISVVDLGSETVLTNAAFFDPTPASVRNGRRHFYNTRLTSGLGTASCASCHVDGRFDRLAWDLGDPLGAQVRISTTNRNFGNLVPDSFNHFHPMKGAMVTLTMQDIIGHEPFHWRADRLGIEQFNSTFVALQGRDKELTLVEMQEFEDFLATVRFPPNRFRNLDNSLPTALPLSNHTVLGRGTLPVGSSLPPGNAGRGLEIFRENSTRGCGPCHTVPTGLGTERTFLSGRWVIGPNVGTNGEHRLAVIQLPRSGNLPFKIPSLRSISEKMGANFSRANGRAGFGFLHDGRVDTLVRFVQDGFEFIDDQETADLIAFLLAMPGGEVLPNSFTDSAQPPGTPGQDVPSCTGRQITITNSSLPDLAQTLLRLAGKATNRVDLVVRGSADGLSRAWVLQSGAASLLADRNGETLPIAALPGMASANNPLTFTAVPAGFARRLALDRDGDGWFDRTELEYGSDPIDSRSHAVNTAPAVAQVKDQEIIPGQLLVMTITASDQDFPPQKLAFAFASDAPMGATLGVVDGVFCWRPETIALGSHRIAVQVTDDGKPPMTTSMSFQVLVAASQRSFTASAEITPAGVRVGWASMVGARYRVEFKKRLPDPAWSELSGEVVADRETTSKVDTTWSQGDERYYRVRKIE